MCYTCNGQGTVPTTKELKLKIPKGISDGVMFKYPNIGDYTKEGVRGDIYFIIKVRPHNTYTVDGLNLRRKLNIPVLDVILGTDKEFKTLSGKVKIKIPKLSEMNKIFRLKGMGVMDEQTNITGDLYVTLDPQTPIALTELEELKLKELKNLPNFSH